MSLTAPKVLFPGNNPTLVIPRKTINLLFQGRYNNNRSVYQQRWSPYTFVRTPDGVSKVKMTAIYPDPVQFLGEDSYENCEFQEVGGSFMVHSSIELCKLYHYSTSCPEKYESCLDWTILPNGHYSLGNPTMITQEVEVLANWLGEASWGHHVIGGLVSRDEFDTVFPNAAGGDADALTKFKQSYYACEGYMSKIERCDVFGDDFKARVDKCESLLDQIQLLEDVYHKLVCCAKAHSKELKKATISGVRAPGGGSRRFQLIVSESLWNLTVDVARIVSRRIAQNPNCPEACSALEYMTVGNDMTTPDIYYNGHLIIPEDGFCYWDMVTGKDTYAAVATVQGNIGFAGRTNPIGLDRLSTISGQLGTEVLREGVGLVYQKKPGLHTKKWEMFYGMEVGSGIADSRLAVGDVAFV